MHHEFEQFNGADNTLASNTVTSMTTNVLWIVGV
jgi:hypothetical protein